MFDWSWWPSRKPSLYGRLKTLESKLIHEKKWGSKVESFLMLQISTICFGLVHITQMRHFDFRRISTFSNFHLCQKAKKKCFRIFSIMSIWNFLGILTVIYLWTDRNWVIAMNRWMLPCPMKEVIVYWLRTAQEL